MFKYFSAFLILLLCFTFLSCNQGKSQNTGNTVPKTNESADGDAADVAKKISENALKPLANLKNPNSMQLETKARSSSQVASDRKLIEDGAEYIMKYAFTNGIDAAIAEINKGRDGEFKNYIPAISTYLSIVAEAEEGVWEIKAHIINDYIGMAVPVDQMVDFSGWKFLIEANESQENTNRIWINDTNMKDPSWADGKICRQSSYYRWFNLDGKKYSAYYALWIDE